MINKASLFKILDAISIILALCISSWLMLPPYLAIFSDYTGASTFTVVIFLLSFYMLGCYDVFEENFKENILRIILASCIGGVGAGFLFYTFENWRFPRLMFVLQIAMTLSFAIFWRWLYDSLQKKVPLVQEKILFLGSTEADKASKVLKHYSPESLCVGYVGKEKSGTAAGTYLGPAASMLQVARSLGVTKVLVLDSSDIDSSLAQELVKAKMDGLAMEDMRTLYEHLASRLPIDLIEDQWLILSEGFNLNTTAALYRIKRIFDLAFASFLLVLALPILLLTAICIRIESPGPIIYSQRRVGLHGKEFTVYKIRSMRQDAETGKAVWASVNDSRVTKVGKFIRKTRIDELPQLINVFKNEMSIIGPRPERPDFVKTLQEQIPYYDLRHSVKPGITGWAQVMYPYGASIEDARYKLEYDLYYIKNMSLLLDIKIVLKTIGVILFPTGAR